MSKRVVATLTAIGPDIEAGRRVIADGWIRRAVLNTAQEPAEDQEAAQ